MFNPNFFIMLCAFVGMPSFNKQKPLLVCSKGNERGRTNNNGAAKIEAAIDVMLPTAANSPTLLLLFLNSSDQVESIIFILLSKFLIT
jgi:hypothetical protein